MFFSQLSSRFQMAKSNFNSHVEVRQFTAACELICNGVGVSVVSELDAVQYAEKGLSLRPFAPTLPHRISLVRPIHKTASMLTKEFIAHFEKSVESFRA